MSGALSGLTEPCKRSRGASEDMKTSYTWEQRTTNKMRDWGMGSARQGLEDEV